MNQFIFKLEAVQRELYSYKTCSQNMWRGEMFKYFGPFQLKQKHWWSNLEQESMKIICKGAQNFYTKDVFSSILRSCWRGKITFFLCYCYDK